MYAIVHFTESEEVEVVPCRWLSVEQKVAFWPPYKDTKRAKTAVLQTAEPDKTWGGEYFVKVLKTYDETDKSRIYYFSLLWLKLSLTLFFSTPSLFNTDTYEAARKKLPKALHRCSLTSENEGGKRMRM